MTTIIFLSFVMGVNLGSITDKEDCNHGSVTDEEGGNLGSVTDESSSVTGFACNLSQMIYDGSQLKSVTDEGPMAVKPSVQWGLFRPDTYDCSVMDLWFSSQMHFTINPVLYWCENLSSICLTSSRFSLSDT